MVAMKPRVKWIAEIENARLSWAEIAAIFAHEHVIEVNHLGRTSIGWRSDITDREKTDIVLSIIAPGNWCKSYPDGKETCFKFDNIFDPEPDESRGYRYCVRAVVDGGDAVEVQLYRWDRPIARVVLDMDYFEFLETMDFKGEEYIWDKVEN